MTKKSKHPVYDDPSAFRMRFPRIEQLPGAGTAMSKVAEERFYKMGVIRASVTPPGEFLPGYFMSVHGTNRYPSWDEIVWLRYNLIPDAARMTLVVPNLNAYINHEGTHHRFVFTLEQNGWALDPEPLCECGATLKLFTTDGVIGYFSCPYCDAAFKHDLSTWNEEHGNGFNGRREAAQS
jgi:hypothetical protein